MGAPPPPPPLAVGCVCQPPWGGAEIYRHLKEHPALDFKAPIVKKKMPPLTGISFALDLVCWLTRDLPPLGVGVMGEEGVGPRHPTPRHLTTAGPQLPRAHWPLPSRTLAPAILIGFSNPPVSWA